MGPWKDTAGTIWLTEGHQCHNECGWQAVDHPVTHVAVVGLVLADMALILIEILIETGNIAR